MSFWEGFTNFMIGMTIMGLACIAIVAFVAWIGER